MPLGASAAGAAGADTPRSRLLVATRSRHKLRELRELLELGDEVELVAPDEVGIEGEPEETGETFETNARIKARYYAARSGLPTLADDSGLEVDALGGGPGVRTRRYAGPNATDPENNEKLLRELGSLPPERRGARYVCVLALALPGDAGSARRPAHDRAARHVSRSHRDGTQGQRRVRLRPDLRALVGAARWRDARPVERRGEARDLAPLPGCAAHDPDAASPRVLITPGSRGRAAGHRRPPAREVCRSGLRRGRGAHRSRAS